MKVRQRKRKSGATYWFMDFTLNGQRQQVPIKGVKTKREAEDVAKLYWAKVTRENLLGEYAGPSAVEQSLTLKGLLETDRERVNISDATRSMEARNAKPVLRILGERTPVASLTPALVEKYKRTRQDEGRASRTINMELKLLNAAINRAVKLRKLCKAPCTIERLTEETKERKVLTRQQVAALLMECHALGIGDEVTVLANCALRRGELFSLRWGAVDFERAVLMVETRKHGGAGAARVEPIPLNASALEALRRRAEALPPEKRHPERLIFGIPPEERNEGRARNRKGARGTVDGVVCLHQYGFRHLLKAAAKAAGIVWWKELRPHDLRHYLATAMLQSGATLPDTAKLLRHRSPTITLQVYAHAMDSTLRQSLDKLSVAAPVIEVLHSGDAEEGGIAQVQQKQSAMA